MKPVRCFPEVRIRAAGDSASPGRLPAGPRSMGADVNLADLDEGGRPSFAVRHATVVDHVIFPGKLRSG